MQLDERDIDTGDGIAQRHRGVRKPAGVDDHEVDLVQPRLVQAVDKRALVVRLERAQCRPVRGH